MQVNSWHKLFHFHLSFESGKFGDKGKKTKIWISREGKEVLRWNKKHFSWFLKGYNLVKNKKNVFILISNTHKQNTRSVSHGILTKPSCSTSKYGINAFSASAIKSWNFFQKRFSNNNLCYPTLNSNCWLRTTFLILKIRNVVKN